MTNGQNNSGERLDRIEAIVESLARSAQAINNNHDDRPTILRRLMTIENKVDRILEKE